MQECHEEVYDILSRAVTAIGTLNDRVRVLERERAAKGHRSNPIEVEDSDDGSSVVVVAGKDKGKGRLVEGEAGAKVEGLEPQLEEAEGGGPPLRGSQFSEYGGDLDRQVDQ